MCIIIYLPQGKKISKRNLKDAWHYNSDGGGMAYLKNNKVYVRKGYLKFNDFFNECEKIINDTSLERIIHFRFTSRGTTNQGQTHPFPLSKSEKDLNKITYSTTMPVLFHNGTLSCKVENGFNDTQSWIRQELYKYKKDLPKLFNILNKDSSRWVIATPNKVSVTDDFIEENGIYYSNLYWRTDYMFLSFKPKKSKKNRKKKTSHKKKTPKTLKKLYENSEKQEWLKDPYHDYDNDEDCCHCYRMGLKCVRCFRKNEKRENNGKTEITYIYDYYSDDVSVCEFAPNEAK